MFNFSYSNINNFFTQFVSTYSSNNSRILYKFNHLIQFLSIISFVWFWVILDSAPQLIASFFTLSEFQVYVYIFELVLIFPMLSLFILKFFFNSSDWVLKRHALLLTSFSFLISLKLLYYVSYSDTSSEVLYTSELWRIAQLTQDFSVFQFTYLSHLLTESFAFYLDGVSLFFILLTTFLIPVCILVSWYSQLDRVFLFLQTLLILEIILVNCFFVSNLLFFFIFFEAVLFPMFFIIGIWGSRDRKIHAVYQFLLYTLVGSVFLYVAIFYLWTQYDTLDFLLLKSSQINFTDQKILFWLLFISFAFKIPLFPVHIWLPEAHVEAPTFGSIILAGLLLKLGTYGMMRFLIPIVPDAVQYFSPIVLVIVTIGIFYTSFSTTRQLDLKKIIAYSSIGHMGFVILGLFTTLADGFAGSLHMMIGHGVVSSALFMSVGFIYDRYHTRNIPDLRGLARFMPFFAIFFLIFTLANVSFPGTFNFVAEVGVLLALMRINIFMTVVVVFSIIFIMVYAFWLYNRVMYGSSLLVFDKYAIIGKYMDLSLREFTLFMLFAFLTIFFGIYPNLVLDFFTPYCEYLELSVNYAI